MKDRKLEKILQAARGEPSPAAPSDFESRVMQQVRRDQPKGTLTFFEGVNLLFPKLTWAAVILIGLCVAGDLWLGAMDLPSLSEGVARITDQWFLPLGGI